MPLTLTESQKKKLVGQIRQALPEVQIESNYRIIEGSAPGITSLDETISIDPKIKKELVSMIGDKPLSQFFMSYIYSDFWDRELEEIEVQSLKDLPDLPSFEQISKEMLDDFLALPHRYCIFYPLPPRLHDILKAGVDELEFGQNIKIVRWNDELKSTYKNVFTHKVELTASTYIRPSRKPENSEDANVVLKIEMVGFFDMKNRLNSSHDLNDIIRSLMGLFYANNIINYLNFSRKDGSSVAFRYRKQDYGYEQDGINVFSGSLFRGLSDCFITTLHRKPRTYAAALERVRTAINSSKSDKIKLASRWLFDSLVGDNELLSFVQATICLEILLGDQKHAEQLSIGDILSNRCAYMIGHNESERSEILTDFKNIYAVRSEIVHRGKPRLSAEDKEQYRKLMTFASRVIVKEIDLLSEPTF